MLDRQGRKIQCVEEPYSADFSISTSDQEKYCIKKGIFFQEDAPLQVLVSFEEDDGVSCTDIQWNNVG